jgi:hypothetical protein
MDGPVGHVNTAVDWVMVGPMGYVNRAVIEMNSNDGIRVD